MFRIDAPSAEDLIAFHSDGYIVCPAVLTDKGIAGLTDEILSHEQVIDTDVQIPMKYPCRI